MIIHPDAYVPAYTLHSRKYTLIYIHNVIQEKCKWMAASYTFTAGSTKTFDCELDNNICILCKYIYLLLPREEVEQSNKMLSTI